MRPAVAVRSTLLAISLLLSLAGCSNDEQEMSQKEIQYLSHLDQARFYQRQGELKASTREAQGAIELLPGKIDPYFLIIENLLTVGDAINAERQVKQLLQKISAIDASPTVQNRANLILAEAFRKQAKFNEALSALQGVTSEDNPTRLKRTLIEAQIYLGSGQREEAEKTYNEALELDPKSVEALIGLSKAALSSQNQEAARQFVTQAEDIQRNHPELWLWKGQMAQLEENWSTAEEAYIRALEDIGQYDIMTAQKYTTTTALIQVLRAQGKYSEAYVYEEILAKSSPGRVKATLMAANKAIEAGNLTEAERYLEEVVAQAPEHQQSRLMLGLVKFKQGRPREAQALLAPIVRTGDSAIASKMLAASMIQLGNPSGAQSALAKLDLDDSDPEILTLLAIATIESGDWVNGEALLEKALALKPDNHELRLRYVHYLKERGAYEKALSELHTVLGEAPGMARARSLEIQIQLQSGDVSSAQASADRWIADNPSSVAALLTRGKIAVNQGKTEEAKALFIKAQEAAPESIAPMVALGRLGLLEKDRNEAQRQFREAVQRSPDAAPALQGLIASHDEDETKAFLQTIVDQHPQATGPRLVLLEIALMEGNTADADQLTATLLERKEHSTPAVAAPLVEEVYSNVIGNLSRAKNHKQRDATLNRAQALFPDSENITLLAARTEFDRGNASGATDLLDKAKKQHPDSISPLLMEASFFEQEADYGEAAKALRVVLDKQPNPELLTRYLFNLERSGQSESALAYLESELKAHPADATLRLKLAMLQQANGQDAAAATNYEQLLSSQPTNVAALNNLAWIYHHGGDDRAIGLAEKAYKLSPDNPSVADTYGWILLQSGSHEESVPILEKAHEMQPDSDDIARHLAEAYKTVGMKAEAERLLETLGEQG